MPRSDFIDAPLATIITPISMDHTEFLGDTLTKIAGEKAAILKRHVPAITAEQVPEAMAVIEAQAARLRVHGSLRPSANRKPSERS